MFNCVIFDIDGTLIDSKEANSESLQKVALQYTGKLYSLQELAFSFALPATETLSRLGIEDVDGAFALWTDIFHNELGHKIKLFDGVKETLLALNKHGVFLGVVTSRAQHQYVLVEHLFSSCDFFKQIITVDDVEEPKPSPMPILHLLEKSGCSKEKTIFIGDSVSDMKSALAAGVAFGLAAWGNVDKKNFAHAHYYFDTPQQLLELLN